MPVLDRSELEASPLADLHAIADQLGLDGFRRLRKGALIDAILDEPEGAAATRSVEDDDAGAETPDAAAETSDAAPRQRRRRPARSRRPSSAGSEGDDAPARP